MQAAIVSVSSLFSSRRFASASAISRLTALTASSRLSCSVNTSSFWLIRTPPSCRERKQDDVPGNRKHTLEGISQRNRSSLVRLFAPCAARIVGRQVSFLQEACTVWKGKRRPRLCFRIRHPSEASACAMMLALHRHETGGTLALPRPAPSFRGSQLPELYDRFQPVRCSTAASLSVSRYHP